jgi:hypothetical protein
MADGLPQSRRCIGRLNDRRSASRAATALGVLSLSILLGSCSGAAPTGPHQILSPRLTTATALTRQAAAPGLRGHLGSGTSLEFRDEQTDVQIANPGTRLSFSSYGRVVLNVTVTPGSAARITQVSGGPTVLASAAARTNWLAAGSPRLPAWRASTYELPPDTWGFLVNGSPLTFREVVMLPTDPAAIAAEITQRVGPASSARTLKNYGFFLANAPISVAVRRDTLLAIASLHGLSLCGALPPTTHSQSLAICATDGTLQTEIDINTNSGVVSAVTQHLVARSREYPGLPAGAVVESDAFAAT